MNAVCKNIVSVKKSEKCTYFNSLITEFESLKSNLWGKSIPINKKKTESKTFVKQARSLVSVLSQQEDAYDKIVEGINNNKKF